MTRFLTIAVPVVLLAWLTAWTMSRPAPAEFRYVNTSGIHTLDPARMSWTSDFRVALNIWEGLTSWDPVTLEPVPAAAALPPETSADGTVLVFTIRPDARWSNGDKVTAADFVRGWRRGLEPGTSTDYAFLVGDHIEGAGAYLRWRLAGVKVLTALSRLRDGWSVGESQARALAGGDRSDGGGGASTGGGWPGLPEVVSRVTDEAIAGDRVGQLGAALGAAGVDLEAVHAAVLSAHAREADERFTQVGVRALRSDRLEVRLSSPCTYFLDLLGFPVFLPCHAGIDVMRRHEGGGMLTDEGLVVYDPRWTRPGPGPHGYAGLVTNGPYRLRSWSFRRRARLEANPYHRLADELGCRSIDMLVYDNPSAALMAYEAGDVDFLPDLGVPYEHELVRLARSGARPDFKIARVLATYYLNFNCMSREVLGRPNPLLDARVRRALTMAVDRRKLVEQVLGRGDEVATAFVPSGISAGYASPAGLPHDPEAARRLIAEAGGPAIGPIEFLYPPGDALVCQALARMWERELGLTVHLQALESKSYAERKANHTYMVARANWFADYRDPTTFLDTLRSGNGNNDSGYSSARFDGLLDAARRERDPAARLALLSSAERIVVEEDCPVLPLLHYRMPIAVKPYVEGLHPNARLWFPFSRVSLRGH